MGMRSKALAVISARFEEKFTGRFFFQDYGEFECRSVARGAVVFDEGTD